MDGPDEFTYYWHKIRKEQRMMSCRQKSRRVVMVCGAFNENCASVLALSKSNQNSKKNVANFKKYLQWFAKQQSNRVWIF